MNSCDLAESVWSMGAVPAQAADFAGDDRDAVTEWLPATVPGDVRADLWAAGRIPDPYFGDNLAASAWVDEHDWWYRCRLRVPLHADQRAHVTFAGIDYQSAVFAGRARLGGHVGMFSPQTYELTPHLRESPELELAVRIAGAAALPRLARTPLRRLMSDLSAALHFEEPYPDRFASLKAPMGYGWDFAPRLLSRGIWDDVTLRFSGSAAISDLWAQPAWPAGADDLPATLPLRVSLEIDSMVAEPALLELSLEGATFQQAPQRIQFPLALRAGRRAYTLQFGVEGPRLWQPWDRGAAQLYRLRAGLHRASNGAPLDVAETHVGLRRVEVDGADWTWRINGQREFIRGLNWVPADGMPGRLRPADYTALVGLAREAGANLLRVWGGGLRERRAFYDACDRAGLLVWQEFPLACAFMGRLPADADYLALLRQEATASVRRLRGHPSLALWCGGNEISPRRNRPALEVVAQAVAQEDGTRPFHPASPSGGDAHEWDVWHGKAPARAYRRSRAAFVSECGVQAAPAVETLRAFLPAEAVWPAGAGWEHHGAQLDKLRLYAAPYAPADLETFVAASQQAQARALQIAIEHARRRKGRCGGLALWQFNEPWPAISWSLVSYDRQLKLAGRLLARWYAPLLVSLDYPLRGYAAGDTLRADLWLINDGLEAWEGCEARLLHGEALLWKGPARVGPDESRRLARLAARLGEPALPLRVEVWQGERRLAENDYDLRFHDPRRGMRLDDWLRRRAADALLRFRLGLLRAI